MRRTRSPVDTSVFKTNQKRLSGIDRLNTCRFIVAIVATVILFGGTGSLLAQSVFNDDEVKFAGEVQTLLLDRKYRELSDLAEKMCKDRPLFQSGRPQLEVFYEALSNGGGQTKAERLRGTQDRIEQVAAWYKASDKPAPRIVLAAALIHKGWLHRGGDFADRVSNEAAREFLESLQNADLMLKEAEQLTKRLKIRDPALYSYWITAGTGLGFDRARQMKLLDQSLAYDPWWEESVEKMAMYLLPQWHGEAGDLTKLALQVGRKAGPAGNAQYATVAIAAQRYPDRVKDEFQWDRIRTGLRDKLKRAPDSALILGQLLKWARQEKDRETAAEAIKALKGRWHQNLFLTAEVYLRYARWTEADFYQGMARKILEGFRGPVYSVSFLEKGSVVVGISSEPIVRRFRVNDGEALDPLNCELQRPELSVAANDGTRLYVAGYGNSGTKMVSIDTRDRESANSTEDLSARPVALALDKKARYVALGLASGSIRRWEEVDPPQPFEWPAGHSGMIGGLAFSTDGAQLASVGGVELIQWDLAKRTEVRRWQCHEQILTSVAWSPDGTLLATAGAGNEVRLWNAATGARIGEMLGGNCSFMSLTFSSSGHRLVGATRSWDQPAIPGEIVVWSMPDRKRISTLTGHALGIWKVDISPDEKTIASASADGTLRLWDLP